MTARRALALAALLGGVHALALSVSGLWWLQILSAAALCLLLFRSAEEQRPLGSGAGTGQAALLGFTFGFSGFLSGVGWLFISMHRYGDMPALLAALALALFCAYLALFPAIACAVGHRLAGHYPAAGALGLAGAYTLTEWLRGWLFTGFPWLSPGYAHTDGPFAAIAPWLGVYGVGAIAVLIAALVAQAMHSWRISRTVSPLGCLSLAGALMTLVGLAHIAQWGSLSGQPVRVDLIQGNIAQDLKFDPRRSLAAMQAYISAVEPGRADLVVMPETAWTVPWHQTPPPLAEQLRAKLGEHTLAAIGMPLVSGSEPRRISNSMAVLNHAGDLVARYDKRHLVPFGEFIPTGFAWFVAMMKIPLGEFHRGADAQPLLVLKGHRIAFNICYEDLFARELAAQVRSGANILINTSNIAWFGDSHALPQHLEISRMRALELARPMLRATNTGVTAVIDHQGTVRARLATHEVGTLSATVTPVAGLTPYARFGDGPAVLLGLLLCAGAGLLNRHARRVPARP